MPTDSVARKASPNPDGKGANGLMLDIYRTEASGLIAKPRRQVLAELFTSMLVLNAQIRYRPSIGVQNYLYCLDSEWFLSLIAPDEWTHARQQGFVGTCILHSDMTWTITPCSKLGKDNPVTAAVASFYAAFAESLDTRLTLEEILPFFVGHLPYYQRLYANALSRSLRATIRLGGQATISGRHWRKLLPQQDQILKQDKHIPLPAPARGSKIPPLAQP